MRHKFDKALRGDFWNFIPRQQYHLTFYDVFDYITHHDDFDEDVGRWAGRLVSYSFWAASFVCRF
jgi:hypothetical protein